MACISTNVIFVLQKYHLFTISMNKHTKPTLQKLEQVLKEIEFVVRYEKGSFNSGYCLVEDKKVVIINKFFDTDGRVNVLLDILPSILEDENLLSEKSKSFVKLIFKSRESNLYA